MDWLLTYYVETECGYVHSQIIECTQNLCVGPTVHSLSKASLKSLEKLSFELEQMLPDLEN